MIHLKTVNFFYCSLFFSFFITIYSNNNNNNTQLVTRHMSVNAYSYIYERTESQARRQYKRMNSNKNVLDESTHEATHTIFYRPTPNKLSIQVPNIDTTSIYIGSYRYNIIYSHYVQTTFHDFSFSFLHFFVFVLMAQRLARRIEDQIGRSPVQIPPKTNFSIMIKLPVTGK